MISIMGYQIYLSSNVIVKCSLDKNTLCYKMLLIHLINLRIYGKLLIQIWWILSRLIYLLTILPKNSIILMNSSNSEKISLLLTPLPCSSPIYSLMNCTLMISLLIKKMEILYSKIYNLIEKILILLSLYINLHHLIYTKVLESQEI